MATGGDATGAEGLVEIADVSLLNGYIHLEGVRSLASAAPDGTSAASFVADRVTVAGRPAKFTQDGVKFFDSNQPGGQFEASVNQFLKGIGFEVHVIEVSAADGKTSVAGLAVRFARQVLPADIPGVVAAGEDRVTLHIGFASASALVTRVPDLGDPTEPVLRHFSGGPTGGGPVSRSAEGAPAPEDPTATWSASSAGIDAMPVSLGDSSAFAWPAAPERPSSPGPVGSAPDQEAVAFASPAASGSLLAAPGRGLDLRWSILPACLVGLLGIAGLNRLVRRVGSVSP
jgi:hypothetical protein